MHTPGGYHCLMGMRERFVQMAGRTLLKFSAGAIPFDWMRRVGRSGHTRSETIDRDSVFEMPPLLKARNQICSIGSLPLHTYGPDRQKIDTPLFEQIDRDVPNVTTLTQTLEDLFLYGIAWWEITEFDELGYPLHARRLDPITVDLQPPANGRNRSPLPHGYDPRGAVVYVDGRPVPTSAVIRFDSPNPGLLMVAGRTIRRAFALDDAALLYAENPLMVGYLTPTKEGKDEKDPAVIQQTLDDWAEARHRHVTAFVPKGLEYVPVAQPTPQALQLVEQQRQVFLEIANLSGIDPEDLGISTTSRTYLNGVDRRLAEINRTLMPFMRALSDRLSMADVTRPGHIVRFDTDDYLRADPETRAKVETMDLANGTRTINEIRAEHNLPPLPGGDVVTQRIPATVGGNDG